jgi:hypothetical protein
MEEIRLDKIGVDIQHGTLVDGYTLESPKIGPFQTIIELLIYYFIIF